MQVYSPSPSCLLPNRGTISPDLCSDDPTRVLLRQMMGAFAEYERKMIVQKLRGARQRAKASRPGYREGRKPFGERPGEVETVARIVELRAQGYTLTRIAEVLSQEVRKPRAGVTWYEKQIARIISGAGLVELSRRG